MVVSWMPFRKIIQLIVYFFLTLAAAVTFSAKFEISFTEALISMGAVVGLSFLAGFAIEKIDERP